MRQCAGYQGKGTTRSSTAHVATKSRTEENRQHAKASPNKLRKHNLGIYALDGSTAPGAYNNPESSAKKVCPGEQRKSDREMSAPGHSTVSGAIEVPKGRIKTVTFLLNPKEGRTEETDSAEEMRPRRRSALKKVVPVKRKTAVHNKYEVLRTEMEEEDEVCGQETFWIYLSGNESEEEIASHDCMDADSGTDDESIPVISTGTVNLGSNGPFTTSTGLGGAG